MNYQEVENKIIDVLEKTPFCTVANANKKGEISTAQMCLVNDGLTIYMQTDSTFEKIQNIKENDCVAINCGAYNFKGKAKIIGHPTLNKIFIEKIKKKHPETFEHYTNLDNEVLIEVKPIECKIWGIKSDKNQVKETVLVVNFQNKTTKEILCDRM